MREHDRKDTHGAIVDLAIVIGTVLLALIIIWAANRLAPPPAPPTGTAVAGEKP